MKETFYGRAAILNEEAKVLLAQGQYVEAISVLKEVQSLVDEPSQVLHNQIGHAYRALRDFDQSIHHFSKALEVHDNSTDRVNRALVYRYSNQCKEATLDAMTALRMEPVVRVGYRTDVEAHLILVECYTLDQQFTLALEHVDAGIHVAGENGVRPERIDKFKQLRVNIAAIAQGEQYLEDFFGGFVSLDYQEGVKFFEEGRYEEAISVLESARQAHGKESSRILNRLARSYSGLGDDVTAIKYFTRAIEVRDNAFNRVWRALGYFWQWDYENAYPDAEQALTFDPNVEPGFHTSVEASWITANCQGASGYIEEALADLEVAIRLARESDYPDLRVSHMQEVYQGALDQMARKESVTSSSGENGG